MNERRRRRAPSDQPLTASVLDRLLDDNPDSDQDSTWHRYQTAATLSAAIRRDLENLLNTRQRAVSWPDEFDELDLSIVGYGVPDFTGFNLATIENREQFRRLVEEVIRRFEPRFRSVRVKLIDGAEPLDRRLRLSIQAVVDANPAERITFETFVEPITRNFHVVGTGHE